MGALVSSGIGTQKRAGARTWMAETGSVRFLRCSLSNTTGVLLSQNSSKYKVPAEWYTMYRLREETLLYTWQEERPLEETVKSVPALQIQSTSL